MGCVLAAIHGNTCRNIGGSCVLAASRRNTCQKIGSSSVLKKATEHRPENCWQLALNSKPQTREKYTVLRKHAKHRKACHHNNPGSADLVHTTASVAHCMYAAKHKHAYAYSADPCPLQACFLSLLGLIHLAISASLQRATDMPARTFMLAASLQRTAQTTA